MFNFTIEDSVGQTSSDCHQISLPFPSGRVGSLARLACIGPQSVPVLGEWQSMMQWADNSVRWAIFKPSKPLHAGLYQITELDEESTQTEVDPAQRSPSLVVGDEQSIVLDSISLKAKILLSNDQVVDWLVDEPTSRSGVATSSRAEKTLSLRSQQSVDPLCLTIQCDFDNVQRVAHWRITLRNPQAAAHPGGIWELGDSNAVLAKEFLLQFNSPTRRASQKSTICKSETNQDWSEVMEGWSITQLGSGGPNHQSPIHRTREGEVPVKAHGYRERSKGTVKEGERATPAIVSSFEKDLAIGLYVPQFWQNFPMALTVESEGFTLKLWPEEFGELHELQPGEQKTYEFWTAVGSTDEVCETLDALRNPALVRIDPSWIAECQIIPWLSPRESDSNKDYLALIDQAIEGDDSFFVKREKIDQYGWRHFGDVWGDHEAVYSDPSNPYVSQYNNQYDMVLGFGINYLRGGDAKWLELMKDLARHTIDIDIYHTDEDRSSYNHGMFWHTVHYVDAGLSTHRTYPAGTCGGGPSSGHAYARGLLLYYCLTGDETAREAVVKMGDWMIASEDGRNTKYRFLAGGETGLTSASGTEDYHGPGRGPGNAVEVLVTAFELTHEKKYLGQAEQIIRRVVHPDQDISHLDLLDAENKWFYTLFLQALGRYIEVKIAFRQNDKMYAYARRTLLRFADWMADNEYPYLDKPELLEYPTETWAAQEMRKVEVFQWAARHADDAQRSRFLERAEFFFETGCRQLKDFDTKSLCRPIALLLTNGYSRSWFQTNGLAKLTHSPQPNAYDFGMPLVFHSQKWRAIRNAKRILAVGSVAGIGLVGLGVLAALGFFS